MAAGFDPSDFRANAHEACINPQDHDALTPTISLIDSPSPNFTQMIITCLINFCSRQSSPVAQQLQQFKMNLAEDRESLIKG